MLGLSQACTFSKSMQDALIHSDLYEENCHNSTINDLIKGITEGSNRNYSYFVSPTERAKSKVTLDKISEYYLTCVKSATQCRVTYSKSDGSSYMDQALDCQDELKLYMSSKDTASALDILFEYVESAFDIPDFQKINFFLLELKPTDFEAEMLISVLRATSRAKHLPAWKNLLPEARKKIIEEGLPNRLLRGL